MLATYEPVGWHAIDYHSAFRSLPPPMPGHLLCSIGPLSTATASSSADVAPTLTISGRSLQTNRFCSCRGCPLGNLKGII